MSQHIGAVAARQTVVCQRSSRGVTRARTATTASRARTHVMKEAVSMLINLREGHCRPRMMRPKRSKVAVEYGRAAQSTPRHQGIAGDIADAQPPQTFIQAS